MPHYLLLRYGDEAAGQDEFPWGSEAHADRIRARVALQPSTTATSVRSDGDAAVILGDGPFVETREALGGVTLIEARDLDEAIAIAADSLVPSGGVEVRPVLRFLLGA
jgi:hypothetical protein